MGELFLGLCLIIISFPVLWNNERKSVKIQSMISKAKKICTEVDYRKPQAEDNFKLVYASGTTTNQESIFDEDFDLEVENSIKLVRNVEMYQWIEHESKRNEETEYTYEKVWRSTLVDSSSF